MCITHTGQTGGRKNRLHTCSGKHSSACQCLPPNKEPFLPLTSVTILSLTFNDVLAACACLIKSRTTRKVGVSGRSLRARLRAYRQSPIWERELLETRVLTAEICCSLFTSTHKCAYRHAICWSINFDG